MSNFYEDLNKLWLGGYLPPASTLVFRLRHLDRIENSNVQLLISDTRSLNGLMRNGVRKGGGVLAIWDKLGEVVNDPKVVRPDGFKNVGALSCKKIRAEVIDFYYDTLSHEEERQFWQDCYDDTWDALTDGSIGFAKENEPTKRGRKKNEQHI